MLLTGGLIREAAEKAEPNLTLWRRGGAAARGRQCARPPCAAGWGVEPTPRAPPRPWPWRPGSTARCRWGCAADGGSDPSTPRWPGPGKPAAPLRGSWSPDQSASPHRGDIPPLAPGYTSGGKQASLNVRLPSHISAHSLLFLNLVSNVFLVKYFTRKSKGFCRLISPINKCNYKNH